MELIIFFILIGTFICLPLGVLLIVVGLVIKARHKAALLTKTIGEGQDDVKVEDEVEVERETKEDYWGSSPIRVGIRLCIFGFICLCAYQLLVKALSGVY